MSRALPLLFAFTLGCTPSAPPPTGAPAPAEPAAGPRASAASSAPVEAGAPEPVAPLSPALRAKQLADRFIILDGHVDLPWRLWEGRDAKGQPTEDVLERTPKGQFDLPRAREGGLDAAFMSIYVPAKYETGGAKKLADQLIDLVVGLAARAPDRLAVARSPAEVRANAASGKFSLLLGMENGSPIEKKLDNLRHFHERGVRYITLAHSKDNHISDSSYDERHTNKGLSPFGEQVVAEMNRLGILVDVSHLSDAAFDDVVRVTKVPIIASHSSCRRFTPGWQRNMSDDSIRKLADNGGVIQVNFGSGFVDGELQKQESGRWKRRAELLARHKVDANSAKGKQLLADFERQNPRRFAKVEQVADHIDHVVKLVGVDHVGLGSDFDGLGDSLPERLKDVSQYPNLLEVLIERGYSDADIEKICSGNVLRVWEKAEAFARAR